MTNPERTTQVPDDKPRRDDATNQGVSSPDPAEGPADRPDGAQQSPGSQSDG